MYNRENPFASASDISYEPLRAQERRYCLSDNHSVVRNRCPAPIFAVRRHLGEPGRRREGRGERIGSREQVTTRNTDAWTCLRRDLRYRTARVFPLLYEDAPVWAGERILDAEGRGSGRRALALRPAWSRGRPWRPFPSKCFRPRRCLHNPLRLLPAGTTVAGRDSHPLWDGAFP